MEIYKKLNALRLEVDGLIVDDIKISVDELVKENERLKKNIEDIKSHTGNCKCGYCGVREVLEKI